MTCPCCKNVMEKGAIHSDRYALKWISDKNDIGTLFAPFVKGIKLTNINKSYVDAFYCEACNKIIIDIE